MARWSRSIVSAVLAGSMFVQATVTASAAEPAPPTAGRKATDTVEEKIDFERARHLLERRRQGERLDVDEEAYLQRAIEARQKSRPGGDRRGGPAGQARAVFHRDTTGLEPLSEMTAADRYLGQDGGLYGEGKNTPPEAHRRAALAARDRIEPLGSDGQPRVDGKILLVSISMSNATQEFAMFKRLADRDEAKSARVQIVDCAQGAQAMAQWAVPDGVPWATAMQRIADADASPEQVQVAWIKLANMGPGGDLEEHGRTLQRDTLAVVQNAKARFPNLQLVYLGSRIYGGYASRGLNPEPYAYESAFAARWLIQDQIAGHKELNHDPAKGAVKSAVLLWGPYLWADGVKPRVPDKLVWLREDFVDDGTHPSTSGREKVARLLLDFFKSDETATTWFVR